MTVGLNAYMSRRKHFSVALLVAAAAVTLFACGSDDDADTAAATSDFEAALKRESLDAIPDYANQLLPGGTKAFEESLRELRGNPVVVNKWASWCGPCRAEFPYFQSQAERHGKEVAFLGVDSNDGEDSARDFLAEFPVPYPSYLDPDLSISDEMDAATFPATAFYDSKGELAYVRQGGYGSEQELAADINRYAR
jgi:cytochrome c biogenesis protein CcmG, thiol:disulfide interchange protein DsbE